MCHSLLIVLTLFCSMLALAQNSAIQPVNQASPNASITPAIAYETVKLPQDRVQAWEMLRAATGLSDDTLQPWYFHAHYKTYDAYGKPKSEGTLEYVRVGPGRWHYTFTEGANVFSRWKTDKGLYSIQGQPLTLPYPTSLILGQLFHPLGKSEADKIAPALFIKQKFGSTTLSCFSSDQNLQQGAKDHTDLKRACTVEDRPLLMLRQGNYDVFFQEPVAFQHRIISKITLMKFGADAVIDINLDLLRTANSEDINALEPPPNAEFQPKTPEVLSPSIIAGHIMKKPEPFYPMSAKQRRVQGTVKLAAVIGVDGTIKNLEVMHSPDLELTNAAEDAVKHWMYTPYLVDGKPTEVSTEINVTFTLGR